MRHIYRGLIVCGVMLAASVSAHAQLWGTAVTDPTDLANSRSSAVGGGITAAAGTAWADGGFTLNWNVFFDDTLNRWVYEYSTTVSSKGVSHLLMEITNLEGEEFEFDAVNSSPVTVPATTYTATSNGNSNPNMPNPLYGIKFDFGGEGTTDYTLVTDRAPVWGVFYAKGGKDGGINVTAWADALNHVDYMTNDSLTKTAFIVRPDGVSGDVIPEPASVALMALGGLMSLRRRTAGGRA